MEPVAITYAIIFCLGFSGGWYIAGSRRRRTNG